MSQTDIPRFQAGGTVRPGSLYVQRAADDELLHLLQQGKFAYVLAPRQIGKSSLRDRTARALTAQGCRCALIDLSSLSDSKAWYLSVCYKIETELDLGCDVNAFFSNLAGTIDEALIFLEFLRKEVLACIPGNIVVFLDEIDAMLSPGIPRDSFLAAVRSIDNEPDPVWRRLTFCLLGVATPGELMEQAAKTPFNTARGVWLLDFTDKEAEQLLPGLVGLPGNPEEWLQEVMRWTSGNPYMTQRLCEALVDREDLEGGPPERVATLVTECFFQRQDDNLTYVRTRLTQHESPSALMAALALYRRLLTGETVPLKDENGAQMSLRLAGLAGVRRREGRMELATRNRVFAHVYDEAWVRQMEGERSLLESARKWDAAARIDDLVLRGNALREALVWARGADGTAMAAIEREFLQASRDLEGKQALDAAAARELAAKARARRQLINFFLVAALVLAIAIITAVWQVLDAQEAGRRMREAAQAQAAETVRNIEERVRSQIDVAVAQSRLNERLLLRDFLSPKDLDSMAKYLLDALTVHETLSFFSFSLDATGDLCQAMRESDGHLSIGFLRHQQDGRFELSHYALRDGHRVLTHSEPDKPENDPRKRPFYAVAREEGNPTWTETYTFLQHDGDPELPGVSYVTPVFGPDHKLTGVLTADFDLVAISQFLGSLNVLEHGFAFVVEYRRDGEPRVIAHPRAEFLTHPVKGGGRETVAAQKLNDERVGAMMLQLPASFPNRPGQTTNVQFELNDTHYLGSFHTLRADDPHWVICVVVPEDDVNGAARRDKPIFPFLIAGCLGAAVLLALIRGGIITSLFRRRGYTAFGGRSSH